MLSIDLSGKSAVITGGSSGIGLAITRCLQSAGANCIVLDKDPYPDDNAVDYYQVDLSSLSELAKCLDELTTVHIVINNAGVLGPPRIMEQTPVDWLDASLQVNLKAPMVIAKQLLPRMRESGGGTMINIGSISALKGSAADPAYAAAKAGLLALTSSLAAQYGPYGIRVLAVCPGSVTNTKLTEQAIGRPLTREEHLGIMARLPLRRLVSPEQVAFLVAFLVSPLASAMTGTAVIIDAGEMGAGR